MAARKTSSTGKTPVKARSSTGGAAKQAAKTRARASRTGTGPASAAKAAAPGAGAIPTARPLLRRKELVARIAAETGLRANRIRPVLDGVLAELGRALAAGEGVNLPPLGRITVNRRKQVDGRDVVICKLRRPAAPEVAEKPADAPLEPLAE